jgi:hypothetical protein
MFSAEEHTAIKSTVDSLQAIYTVVLGLSLGEAFMQFVAENGQAEHKIRWDRAVSLLSFLLLIVPFFQGMNRYFFEVYLKPSGLGAQYGSRLLVDCGVFTVEGCLFFVLSRSLSQEKWRRFYVTVLVLLGVDLIWDFRVFHYLRLPFLEKWLILDFAGLAFILRPHIQRATRRSTLIFSARFLIN